MYVATLIANCKNRNLSELILKQVVNDLSGVKYKVLDDNIAVDISLVSEPSNFEIVWKQLQKYQIDIVFNQLRIVGKIYF